MKEFQDFLRQTQTGKIYRPSNILQVIDELGKLPKCSKKGTSWFNIPCSFDIETTSFYDDDGRKTSIMYEWTFGINGLVIIGRTWKQFDSMLKVLTKKLNISTDNRLVIYVHNLAYEFQFIRKRFQWKEVFSLEERKPITALTYSGLEFRCSYLLSNYSLAKLGEELLKYKVQKMVGDLDYSKIRHSRTKLTDKELQYCINDVLVVMCYIQEKLENESKICFIPKTNTGYVREYCRNYCFYEYGKSRKESHKKLRYMSMMKNMTLNVPEYQQLKRAFSGGFTHASAFHSGKVLEDVTSIDFTSSYPTVMLAEQFPMSKSEMVEIKTRDEFLHNIKYYCCLFDAHFEGLEASFIYENYISESHCTNKKNLIVNNGRVVSADSIDITLTEQDFIIISKTYKWKTLKVANFRRYQKGYLPRDFIKSILKLYENKTTLKGVDGKEIEYQKSKGMLNSCYGMTVTDIARAVIMYIEGWYKEQPDLQNMIDKYNNSANRFLFYPWGVWVTAYARRNLWTGILEMGEDYIYSDTDSIKFRNYEKHKDYIEKYNKMITKQLQYVMEQMHIDIAKIAPKTIKGVEKPLGVWDFDGHYARFKTLGAKRYMVEYSTDERNEKNIGKISLTVSGLNKKDAIPYMIEKYGKENMFNEFNDSLKIPEDHSGRRTHTYIDEVREGFIEDYQGNTNKYCELSGVHIEKSEYSLSLSREYVNYILSIQEGE